MGVREVQSGEPRPFIPIHRSLGIVSAALHTLRVAFQMINKVYHHPTARNLPLLPRPGLMLVGHAALAAKLLEHAV